ncbi:MAG: hypothetical protein AAFR98_06635 [Pseudomonadota bacterium]
MYIRFVSERKASDTSARLGIFDAAYSLKLTGSLPYSDQDRLEELLHWFETNLPIPSKFSRSTSKGKYRRNSKGISWLKDSSEEVVSRCFDLKTFLEDHDEQISVLRENRLGYILYEDEHQIVAEPFSDTKSA